MLQLMGKILIVENNTELRDFFHIFLNIHHFNVRSVVTRRELFIEIDSFTPDLIILDAMLAREDSREICKQIKRPCREMSIILMSTKPKFLIGYEEFQADGVIEKPFNINDVLYKINSILARKQSL